MYSADKLFLNEFEDYCRALSYKYKTDVFELKIPDSIVISELKRDNPHIYISGIEQMYFSKLNDTKAFLLPDKDVRRRKFDVNADYVKDSNGEYLMESVEVPPNCSLILSPVRIGVPYADNKSLKDFDYVDLYHKEGLDKPLYLYVIPKDNWQEMTQIGLFLSLEKPRRYYNCNRVFSIKGHPMFIFSAPYRVNQRLVNRRLLFLGNERDVLESFKTLLTFWSDYGIIYNIEWLWLDDMYNGVDNAGLKKYQPTLMYEEFIPKLCVTETGDYTDAYLNSLSFGSSDID